MNFKMEFKVNHLNRALAAVRQALAQPKELLGSVGDELLRVNQDRHLAGLAPDGSKWKPLSPLTLQEKRKGGPLNKSGRMLESFKRRGVISNTVTLGFDGTTESQRAAWHHSGTRPYEIKPKNAKALAFAGIVTKRVHHPGLPSRKLVGLPDSDRRLIAEVSDDYLLVILNSVR